MSPRVPAGGPALTAAPTPADRLRIGLGLLLALLQPPAGGFSALTGLGQPIGAMAAASRTAATPAGWAFAIWTPIFALSVAYCAWQALPANRADPLARRAGWPLAACFGLNVLWMLLAQTTGNGWHLVAVIAGVAAFAAAAWLGLRARGDGAGEGAGTRRLLRPLAGLLAGWVALAAFANVAGAARLGTGPGGTAPAAGLVALAGLATAALAWRGRGDPWFAGAVLWGLLAIAAVNGARPAVLAAAAGAALAVAAASWAARRRAGG